jgi:hypothetical protein
MTAPKTEAGKALTAAAEGLPDFRDRNDVPWPWVSRSAAIAAIRGEKT